MLIKFKRIVQNTKKRIAYRSLVLLMSTIALSACVTSAYNLREGIACFKAQDYRRAFIRLKPEADRGNAEAQYAIGYMYFYGQGVTEDKKKAIYWIKCAAKSGQSDARKALKIMRTKPYN